MLPYMEKKILHLIENMDFEMEKLFGVILMVPTIRVQKSIKSSPGKVSDREM